MKEERENERRWWDERRIGRMNGEKEDEWIR